ncbi:uncharacterized protein KY384_000148 [Bacidia gigantensis]|uniref:uncharacterized protein n=1 Tax=Bacidia gigantensis TaxID=2732470 RepID=UPI001D04B001|nr:uncharacterized protein KY384_000148 [Bacidia gigantensis]KAG8526155.1 hypothetical protein KY384_000148 [Bacidia gigantensis]
MGSVLNAILKVSSLVAALPQTATNGKSVLGTLSAPKLADFLTNNPLVNGYPWGNRDAVHTNPYEQSPTTGVTRSYDFTIARGNIAPDGVNTSVLLINGQFPGPTIEANWGDMITVNVHNQISNPEEGTSLHWHGILQRETPWYDGVPSVQQCPIAPGKSFTYNYKADLYGTTWYHSHYSAQYAGGLFGPLIIHGERDRSPVGPKNEPYDIDVGPVLLGDWFHRDYFDLVKQTMQLSTQPPVFSDNSLINGKMSYDCSLITDGTACTPNAGLAKFSFTSGKKHRLRLINGGAEGLIRFTIDNHTMKVMANDFVPVKPYDTNMVTLGIGQRTDVIVEAKMPSDSAVWMRSDLSPNCAIAKNHNGLAAIYYEKANTTTKPTTSATPYDDSKCGNDDLDKTIPFFQFPATQNPATTQQIDITHNKNATGFTVFQMNGESFRANYDHPLLIAANQGNTSYPDDPQWNVYNFGTNSSVRIIFRNLDNATHPMHLHGHNFNVLAEGVGVWDGKVKHIENTQRRDSQMLQAGGPDVPSYLVVQYETDNPGVWPFHCHIAWHVSAGFYINVMEQTEKIKQKTLPQSIGQTCMDWYEYSGHNVVDMIDSGL